MNETETRRKKIDPALYDVGWERVPESVILTEQRAYQITPGHVSALPQNRHPKKADYVLEYRGRKLAIIEAKSDEQQRIVSRLDSLSAHVRELEEVLQKTIAECDALKQALLRKVFE